MSRYDEHTNREWFVRDVRGAHHRCDDEADARNLVAWNPAGCGVVLHRDVHYGPMVEAEQ